MPQDKLTVLTAEEGALEAEAAEEVHLPDWLTAAEGLDTEAGVGHCGSVAAYLDVLAVFADSIQRTAQEIEGYFQAEDWKSYTTKVHALKSTAKIIGADELSERARRLEDAGSAGYIDEIRQDHRALMELYLTYAEKLSPMLPQEEDMRDKPPIDPAELTEAFEAMSEMAAAFDYDSLQFIFESLDEYQLPEKEAALYKEIKAAAAVPDWDKVKELLGQAKEA